MKKLQRHKDLVARFIAENGHEPTAIDFDTSTYLPRSRTIQRTYGGLPQFRGLIGMTTSDFTKGAHRSKKALDSMNDCLEYETQLFIELLKKYGDRDVSSPARIFLNRGFTSDFRIMKDGKTYLVDVFKPNTTQSLTSCVKLKNNKYLRDEQSFYISPVTFLYVCINEDVFKPIENEIEVIPLSEFRRRFL